MQLCLHKSLFWLCQDYCLTSKRFILGPRFDLLCCFTVKTWVTWLCLFLRQTLRNHINSSHIFEAKSPPWMSSLKVSVKESKWGTFGDVRTWLGFLSGTWIWNINLVFHPNWLKLPRRWEVRLRKHFEHGNKENSRRHSSSAQRVCLR